MTNVRRYRTLALMTGAVLLGVGCTDPTRPEPQSEQAHLVIAASVAGTPIAILVATVTAPDIPVPIVKNLGVRDGAASGTLTMPPGLARTITVTAFDDDGQISHEGSRTLDVQRGPNPGVIIPMFARPGEVPISVQVGSVVVTLSQQAASLQVGAALQLVASLESASGETLVREPEWATTAPAIVSVSANGLVLALRPGTAQVVASFGGVAAVATIAVTDASQP